MAGLELNNSPTDMYANQLSEYMQSGADKTIKMAYGMRRNQLASGTARLKVAANHVNPSLPDLNHRVEAESRRIAQRLHDDSAQMLAVVYLELAQIARRSTPDVTRDIARVVGYLDDVCEQLREISHELNPVILDRLGLAAALENLTDVLMARSEISASVSTDELPQLSKDIETVVYRTAQEALSNVRRHSGATTVEIKLHCTGTHILCSVLDNGSGIAGSSGDMHEGLGLTGIRERVATLGGRCVIYSEPGNGTALQVEIPL